MSTHENTFRHVSDELKSIIMHNRGGQKVIERILSAYGFASRQALCKHLEISQSTMANRYARDTFPADWVVICSIETGVSLEWLASGIDEQRTKAPVTQEPTTQIHRELVSDEEQPVTHQAKFPIENREVFSQGGKAAIERLVEAYGFTTRQALADHLKVSKSTLANRYLRDTFPSDWVIQCSIETGTSLLWLASGEGPKFLDCSGTVIHLQTHDIIDGTLNCGNVIVFDRSLLPTDLQNPMGVSVEDKVYIADTSFEDVTDGNWVVEIEGITGVRNLTRIPVGKVKISSECSSFECQLTDIKIVAKCHSVFLRKI